MCFEKGAVKGLNGVAAGPSPGDDVPGKGCSAVDSSQLWLFNSIQFFSCAVELGVRVFGVRSTVVLGRRLVGLRASRQIQYEEARLSALQRFLKHDYVSTVCLARPPVEGHSSATACLTV